MTESAMALAPRMVSSSYWVGRVLCCWRWSPQLPTLKTSTSCPGTWRSTYSDHARADSFPAVLR